MLRLPLRIRPRIPVVVAMAAGVVGIATNG